MTNWTTSGWASLAAIAGKQNAFVAAKTAAAVVGAAIAVGMLRAELWSNYDWMVARWRMSDDP